MTARPARPRPIARRSALLAVLAVLAAGCRSADGAVADLAAVLAGSVSFAPASGPLGPAAIGQPFVVGDRVRTSADGGARVGLRAGGALVLGPATTIQFGADRALDVDGEITAVGQDVVVDLDLGSATVAAGTRVRRLRDGDGFEVVVGRAVVTRGGERLVLGPGDRLEIELGAARVRRIVPAPAPPTEAPVAVDLEVTLRGRARARPAGGDAAPLAAGRQRLAAGTTVELERGARLELARGDQRATAVGPARLVVLPPAGGLFDAIDGRATIDAATTDVAVNLPGGRLVVRRGPGDGSRAEVEVGAGGAHIAVARGEAEVEVGERRERLALGEAADLDHRGRLVLSGRPPPIAVFALDAGGSATIHDPAPPTDVRIRFAGRCAGAGVVEIDDRALTRRTRGDGGAIVRLERGATSYRIRCLDDGRLAARPIATGRLIVSRDAGTRPLPATSPRNTVDADGRRYTVLYQGRLPALSFRWPGAPTAPRYLLEVTPTGGAAITAAADRPQIDLAAGRLAEGTYSYLLRAGAATSRRSTLTIDFDNAASSAYVSAPRPGDRWGARVAVAGATIEGGQVAIDGAAVPLDRQLRFATEVPAPTGESGLAIRFTHPSRGTHYYVRRPAAR